MCTTFAYKQNSNVYFGRNMDIDIGFGEKIVITPRNREYIYKNGMSISGDYAYFGVASVIDGVGLYAEAMNEKGLYVAGLNYPNNAFYGEVIDNKINLAPYELIPFILSTCDNMELALEKIQQIQLIDIPFKPGLPLAPMHFFVSDGYKSIVIEPDVDGIKIYDNSVGVLTNNPSFPYQIYNLQNYGHLSIVNKNNYNFDDKEYAYYGEGLGMIGLPGDVSPVSRFTRTAFYKKHLESLENTINPVSDVFHILENVLMIEGSVLTSNNRLDITRYSICYDVKNKCLYVKTYNYLQVYNYKLDCNNDEFLVYELNDDDYRSVGI